MNRNLLRSVVAILLGWLIMVGGYVVTMAVIALFNPEAFAPGVQWATGWLLVALLAEFVCSVGGGFVTGVIARRREIAHAVGLVLFGLLVSECVLRGRADASLVPTWYGIAGSALAALSPVLGGWLRARQEVLLARIPQSVTRTMDGARLSVAITIDRSRPLIAALVAFVTFVTVSFVGMFSGTLGLIVVLERLFGNDYHPSVAFPVFVTSIIVASILSRRVFRKIMPRDVSLMDDSSQE